MYDCKAVTLAVASAITLPCVHDCLKANATLLLVREKASYAIASPWRIANLVLLAGFLLFVLPQMLDVARFNWSTEQGGHGPIVLATGLWLLWREYQGARHLRQPGKPWLAFAALAVLLPAFVVFGITGILELQVAAMYGALLAGAYLLLGGPLMRAMWFPLIYLAFALPPPDTLVAVITQPVKIAISQWSVSLLYGLGYPVANSGAIIRIAQFELLVAAACSGLNSLITLSAICMFYVYLRHRNDVKAFLTMCLAVLPVAVFSNFVRVIVLILMTYYLGDAAAQGFLHDFAGLLTFAAALATIMAIEAVYSRVTARRRAAINDA